MIKDKYSIRSWQPSVGMLSRLDIDYSRRNEGFSVTQILKLGRPAIFDVGIIPFLVQRHAFQGVAKCSGEADTRVNK